MTEVAIYCSYAPDRVGSQPLAGQLLRCLEHVGHYPYEVVAAYTDIVSASQSGRPGLEQLLTDAAGGKCKAIVAGVSDGILCLPVVADRLSDICANIESCETHTRKDLLHALMTTPAV